MKYTIFVKPGSAKGPLVEADAEGQLTVYIRERAVDGKANQALIELLAGYFNTPKSALAIIRGHAARHKVIEVKDFW